MRLTIAVILAGLWLPGSALAQDALLASLAFGVEAQRNSLVHQRGPARRTPPAPEVAQDESHLCEDPETVDQVSDPALCEDIIPYRPLPSGEREPKRPPKNRATADALSLLLYSAALTAEAAGLGTLHDFYEVYDYENDPDRRWWADRY